MDKKKENLTSFMDESWGLVDACSFKNSVWLISVAVPDDTVPISWASAPPKVVAWLVVATDVELSRDASRRFSKLVFSSSLKFSSTACNNIDKYSQVIQLKKDLEL